MWSGGLRTKLVSAAVVSCCSAAPRIAASTKSQYPYVNRALGFRDMRREG
jgi:hypothetical protein